MLWKTFAEHYPYLVVIVVISGLLIRYFPSIAAICAKDPERKRAALEVLRLRRKDAARLPSYVLPGDTVPVPSRKRKSLPATTPVAEQRAVE